jgi:hypothetical protein
MRFSNLLRASIAGLSIALCSAGIAASIKWLVSDFQSTQGVAIAEVLMLAAQFGLLLLVWRGWNLRIASARLSLLYIALPTFLYLAFYLFVSYLSKIL